MLARFTQWRVGLLDANGRVDMSRIGTPIISSHAAWSAYFSKLQLSDPEMCRFTLERMLEPNPAQRASMAEVRDFVRRLQPVGSQAQADANTALYKAAGVDAKREKAFVSLSLHRARQMRAA